MELSLTKSRVSSVYGLGRMVTERRRPTIFGGPVSWGRHVSPTVGSLVTSICTCHFPLYSTPKRNENFQNLVNQFPFGEDFLRLRNNWKRLIRHRFSHHPRHVNDNWCHGDINKHQYNTKREIIYLPAIGTNEPNF